MYTIKEQSKLFLRGSIIMITSMVTTRNTKLFQKFHFVLLSITQFSIFQMKTSLVFIWILKREENIKFRFYLHKRQYIQE